MEDMLTRAARINEEEVERRRKRDEDYQKLCDAGRIWGMMPRERISRIHIDRVDQAIIDEFLSYEDLSTSVSDILDKFGLNCSVSTTRLKPVIGNRKIVGHAMTIRNIPVRKTVTQGNYDKDIIKMSLRDIWYIGEKGDILVSDFGGNPDISCMGGMAATVGSESGFAGALVNGCVRDVETIRTIDFPVWSIGTTCITGKNRLEGIEINGPVTLVNILVEPGDLMIADASGVCAVPPEYIMPVLEQLRKITNSEREMKQLIKQDTDIADMRERVMNRYK